MLIFDIEHVHGFPLNQALPRRVLTRPLEQHGIRPSPHQLSHRRAEGSPTGSISKPSQSAKSAKPDKPANQASLLSQAAKPAKLASQASNIPA